MTIPNTLREHRKKLGLSQMAVALKMGLVSTDRISRWEKGVSFPHMTNLFKMSSLYGVRPDELYPGLVEYLEATTPDLSGYTPSSAISINSN